MLEELFMIFKSIEFFNLIFLKETEYRTTIFI